MREKFEFSEALNNYGSGQSWVPSVEAWAEIHRLQNEVSRVEEQKLIALESHDKLIALQTQVLAYLAVCQLIAEGKATIEHGKNVLAELERLAVE